MKTAVRDQIRNHKGKAAVRRDLNRNFRRQAKRDLREGYEPARKGSTLERVLV